MFDPTYQSKNFPVIRPEWLALQQEPTLLAGQLIVDPHHHFWEVAGSHYLVDAFLNDVCSAHRVTKSVFVEAGSRYLTDGPAHLRSVGETAFSAAQGEQGAQSGIRPCAGIVGYVDLTLGTLACEAIDQHLQAGRGRFRGVRSRAAWSDEIALRGPVDGPSQGLLLREDFQRGVRELAKRGLCLDVWVYHTQLDDVAQLAKSCPDIPIILNHCGGPLGIGSFAGRREEVYLDWRAGIMALAPFANVSIKLGGLGMPRIGFPFAQEEKPVSSETLAAAWSPYIETCIESAGVDRCMFESNFPVDKGMCSYAVLWNAFKRIVAAYSDDERLALFSGTATRLYRLD